MELEDRYHIRSGRTMPRWRCEGGGVGRAAAPGLTGADGAGAGRPSGGLRQAGGGGGGRAAAGGAGRGDSAAGPIAG
eukprot:2097717-Pyramimonas_sp.AAC.1